jgi:uncharacterized phiE125 gp8 family phage protein
MPLVQLTRPIDTPVSLEEAKEQCRILSSDATHDSLLLRLIDEATRSIETLTGVRLASQTTKLALDDFPSGAIDLGVYPVNSITSVVYDDADNVEQTMVLGTDYWESLSGMYPFICPVTSWPATKYGKPECVRIVMETGYYSGSPITAAAPDDLRHAILIRVKEYFDNAGESITGQSVEETVSSVKALTDMHRRITV